MNPDTNQKQIAGLQPWLPWPLARWAWWTEPVRAERLAALRIGLAAMLLVDLLTSYWPNVADFFGDGAMGNPQFFTYLSESPRYTWSIFRDLNHSLFVGVSMMVWAVASMILAGCSLADDVQGFRRYVWVAWLSASTVYLLGFWQRTIAGAGVSELAWVLPALNGIVLLPYLVRRRRPYGLAAFVLATTAIGVWVYYAEQLPPVLAWVDWPWRDSADLLRGAMVVWLIATVCLLVGFFTKTSAVVVWAMSTSFANLNAYIDNGGDAVRSIILFYLMISPCGAVWSIDRRLRRNADTPIYIHPWPLRLLFIQMALIYFMNGLYKSVGNDWRNGVSLYYVLCDLSLSRFSYDQLPIPFWMTRLASWTVLMWELTFPIAVLFRWPRRIALVMGVAFHVGIFLTMELGGFVPYMLVLYLPLIPWEHLPRLRVSAPPPP